MIDSAQENLWRFEPRPDGLVSVSLDNNIWDWLFVHRNILRLAEELPCTRFALVIPREVEIEHLAIPTDECEKLEKRDFIAETIRSCGIRTIGYFGFAAPPGVVNRYLGFNHGTWMSILERARTDAMRHFLESKTRPTGLAGNQTDLRLAVLSFSSVVLTRDNEPGPLQFARERGGKVLLVDDGHALSSCLAAAILDTLGPATVSAGASSCAGDSGGVSE
ncbi:MAG: hypothetical protein WBW93_07115 [Steroidobacteraceae bacterium]